MPEEINRLLTDQLAEILFVHSEDAVDNLRMEGVTEEQIHFVGNTMIDSLHRFEAEASERAAWNRFGRQPGEFVLVTLHRPSNVDDDARLAAIADELANLTSRAPVVFPLHPRTRARLACSGLLGRLEAAGVACLDPLGYIDFLSLETAAGAVLTDSGGIQEETSALGIRCFTLRPNTERPVTLSLGTNHLLGDDPASIREVMPGPRGAPAEIPGWDGHAGERAAEVLLAALDEGGAL